MLAGLEHDQDAAKQKALAAVHLAALGFHVLPIVAGQKRPPFQTGPGHRDAATRDVETICRWFIQHADWDVALVLHMSGHVAIDVDLKDGRKDQTIRWLQKFEAMAGGRFADQTACQVTPKGGWHYIFEAPEGVDLRSRLAPTIELQRHILVVAPSAGRRWINHPETGVAPFPQALVPRATRPAGEPLSAHHRARNTRSQKSIAGLIRTVEAALEGNRNSTLYWAACALLEQPHSETDMADLVFAATCSGLPLEEAIRTSESASRRMNHSVNSTAGATPTGSGKPSGPEGQAQS